MVSGMWMRMHHGKAERTPPPRRSDAQLRGGGITRSTVRVLLRGEDMRALSLRCTGTSGPRHLAGAMLVAWRQHYPVAIAGRSSKREVCV